MPESHFDELLPTDPLASFRLDGRTAILTGASSGLGRGFALALTAAGANVLAVARRAERLEQLAALSERIVPFTCDVAFPGAAEDMVERAVDAFGGIDIVVNNAGISRIISALEDDVDEFRHELEVDLVAPYELARRAAGWMIEAKANGDRGPNWSGSIVNISSVMGAGGGGKLKAPGYAAAKGGLTNLTRELASQWARKGVRVNAIGPGWFETEMSGDMFSTEHGMAYITDNTPMGRPGSAEELNGALLFLASEASSFVTGQILYVDGGWTAI